MNPIDMRFRVFCEHAKPLSSVRTLQEAQLIYIYRALRFFQWNQTKTAEALGLSSRTMRGRVQYLRRIGVFIPVREMTPQRPPKKYDEL